MTADEILAKLQHSFPGLEKAADPVKNYPTWTVPAKLVRQVGERLRSEFSFDYLDVLTANDWLPVPAAGETPAKEGSFEVVYIVSALEAGHRVCLRASVPRADGASLPSLYGIFMAADWQEREVYDMYGIHFEGHPNLKRILTHDQLKGFPLRKDYKHTPDSYD
ncbi:MAG: NADH-quinone oxidoreductase subunit C [Elusimicrobia bacterium]|nr:NADH-quinone oxidoreductase subunit C [Elusimicrobiota bacterium]